MVDRIEIKPIEHPIDAVVQIPGSKSITNRALLLAALAEGTSRIEGALFSDDTRYMSDALNALGIQVSGNEANATYTVGGTGGKIPSHKADLFLGNAGTATRFLTAALALGQGEYRIDGVERMRQRPLEDLLGALRQLGGDAESELGTGCPPVRIRTNGLAGGKARLRGDASSQYLSALLMVAPLSLNGVEVEITGQLASKPYIGITLRMMEQWSDCIRYSEGGSTEPDQDGVSFCYSVPAGQGYQSRTYHVEPDASTASYFFAAAAVTGGRVRVEGLGNGALQGDLAFVNVLAQMGCEVEQTKDYTEVRGPAQLRGVNVDMNAISDTVMSLAAIAPFADAPTTIRNVGNIRLKETDRLHAVATELDRLGVETKEWNDGIEVYPAKYLRPADIHTYDDHRMAMSFAVTGLKAPGVAILDPGCTAKTVPDFFTRFQSLYCNHGG
jgi:3-phosphoshikimate 1-carboxyvinyltransferase